MNSKKEERLERSPDDRFHKTGRGKEGGLILRSGFNCVSVWMQTVDCQVVTTTEYIKENDKVNKIIAY